MIIDRSQAKLAARNCMRTAQISPYQIGLVYVLIAFAASIFDSLMMSLFATTYYIDSYTTVMMPQPYQLVCYNSCFFDSGDSAGRYRNLRPRCTPRQTNALEHTV